MERLTRNAWTVSLWMLLCLFSAGCTMCDTGNLCDYSAVGGKWQRSDPACGRVGSVLSDPAAYSVGATTPAPGYDGDTASGEADEPDEGETGSEESPLPDEDDLKPNSKDAAQIGEPERE